MPDFSPALPDGAKKAVEAMLERYEQAWALFRDPSYLPNSAELRKPLGRWEMKPILADLLEAALPFLRPSPVAGERWKAEIERLRAWLRLVQATTDPENGYYALRGYNAPEADYIEQVRRHDEHAHPSESNASPVAGGEPSEDLTRQADFLIRAAEDWARVDHRVDIRTYLEHALGTTGYVYFMRSDRGEPGGLELSESLLERQGDIAAAIYERAAVINTSRGFPSFGDQPSHVQSDYFELADAALGVVRAELSRRRKENR